MSAPVYWKEREREFLGSPDDFWKGVNDCTYESFMDFGVLEEAALSTGIVNDSASSPVRPVLEVTGQLDAPVYHTR